MAKLSRAHCVLNELSFEAREEGPGGERRDIALLRTLGLTFTELRRTASVHDRNRILMECPSDVWALRLPGGTAFATAFDALSRTNEVLATLLRIAATDGSYDRSAQRPVRTEHGGSAGLARAVSSHGLAVSLNVERWRLAIVNVRTASRSKTVCNAWHPWITGAHLAVIGRHVPVLPAYEDHGTHDPQNVRYVRGKSHLPANARALLEGSLTGADGTWWTYCEHGFFHRFAGTDRGGRMVAHWNGTTNPGASQVTRVEDVPATTRGRLVALGGFSGCGCREVR
jgi:hypothetical protein